jgi:hypothetical protein
LKKIASIFLLITTLSTLAQVPDSLKNKWIPGFVTGASISQIAFSNWVKGGDNSISWVFMGDFRLDNSSDIWSFKNSIKATYGRSKIGDGVYRTTDNDFYLENVASYNVGWAVSPFISNSVRTQIARGFDYKVDPELEIADFFDPGYITQTIGFTYDKYKNVVTRLGFGFQEIITNKFRQYSDDSETKDRQEAFKFETGFESVTDVNYKLDDNIIYSNKIRLFTQFKSLDVWDVRWDNNIAAKITKLISVNFTYQLVYEKMQSPYTQTKQALLIGITYTLI